MILTYTPAELYGMLSGNTNCLSSITYDSSYLYFDTLGSNKYGFFANIPVLKNFILEYDLVCVGSIYPSFNPTFGSDSITTTDAQYYGFMVAFYDKLEVWRGRNLSNNPSSNSRIATAVSATDYSNAVVVGTPVHVKIQRDTSTITVFLDDVVYQTVTSNDAQASNAGYFGFFNWSGTSCKISNFKITSDEIGGSGILKYLNFTGLSNLVTDIKNWITSRIPTKTSEITNDSGFITSSSLPTVNNATLTIQKNGTNVQTFTANASSNKTANITVPTAVSELTNDSGFLTNTSDCVHIAGNETITGEKTFSGNHVWITNSTTKYLFLKNTSWDLGQATPSSDVVYGGYVWRDKDNQDVAQLRYIDWSNGYSGIRLLARTKFTNGVKDTTGSNVDTILDLGTMPNGTRYLHTNALFHDSVIPDIDNSLTLGNSTYKWKAVYSNSYYLGTTAFGDIVTHNSSEYSLSSHTHSNYLSNSLTNNTSRGALGWSSSIGTNIPTLNTIAYWNGAYTNTTSNLAYCVKGAFGDIVTHNSSEFASDNHTHSYLPLSGGTLTGNIIYKRSNATRGTAPSSNVTIQHCDVKDSANNRITLLETTYYTDMSSKIALFAYKTTAATGSNIGSIGIGCTTSGTVYTFAPTPAASDDSTQIATTAYVKNQGYLSGTVAIANGGTGATTRLNAVKALTNENVGTDTDYFLTITSSWGKAGYCSVANAKTVLGLKSAAYTESSAYAAASHTHSQYLTEHQSLSNYSTKANTVKSLSISGKTITVTPGSGNAYTLTTQDTVYTHPTSAGNKHIPSGGSSGQILKYSSSGTAVWADIDFSRKPDTTVFSKTAWPADGTSTISCTTGCPIWIFFDVTGDNSCKISLSLSNVFVIATKMCVGSQTHKQDTTTYGTILVQSAVGRNRGTVLAWAWSTSLTLTVSHTGTFTNTPSFSVSMKQ